MLNGAIIMKVLRSYLSGQEQPERFVEVTAEGGWVRHFFQLALERTIDLGQTIFKNISNMK
jgi:hypothetical protein